VKSITEYAQGLVLKELTVEKLREIRRILSLRAACLLVLGFGEKVAPINEGVSRLTKEIDNRIGKP